MPHCGCVEEDTRAHISCHNLNYYLTKSDLIYPLYILTYASVKI